MTPQLPRFEVLRPSLGSFLNGVDRDQDREAASLPGDIDAGVVESVITPDGSWWTPISAPRRLDRPCLCKGPGVRKVWIRGQAGVEIDLLCSACESVTQVVPTAGCIVDGLVKRISLRALGLDVHATDFQWGDDGRLVAAHFIPVDNGNPITASEWPAWCEANRDRIITAQAKPRQHQPTETGQLALLDHHGK